MARTLLVRPGPPVRTKAAAATTRMTLSAKARTWLNQKSGPGLRDLSFQTETPTLQDHNDGPPELWHLCFVPVEYGRHHQQHKSGSGQGQPANR